MNYRTTTSDVVKTMELGSKLGERLRGGETFELISDLGGGKTSFVRGLAAGFGSTDPVASPSFTINYVYGRPDGKQLWHFDFYRLSDGGVVAAELAEVVGQTDAVVAVEWGEVVHRVLPAQRISLTITSQGDSIRDCNFDYPAKFKYLFHNL